MSVNTYGLIKELPNGKFRFSIHNADDSSEESIDSSSGFSSLANAIDAYRKERDEGSIEYGLWDIELGSDKRKKLRADGLHDSVNGWCCACEGDIAFLEGRIKDAYTRGRENGKKKPLCAVGVDDCAVCQEVATEEAMDQAKVDQTKNG